jgi:hypothetical protein
MVTIVSEVPDSFTVKMEEADSSETVVNIYHVREDRNLKQMPVCPKN